VVVFAGGHVFGTITVFVARVSFGVGPNGGDFMRSRSLPPRLSKFGYG
jgi:hypothetical protein